MVLSINCSRGNLVYCTIAEFQDEIKVGFINLFELGKLMGRIAKALCKCEYSTGKLFTGGGMNNYTVQDDFPGYCSEGQHVVLVNLLDKNFKCSDKNHLHAPIPYSDARLKNPKVNDSEDIDSEDDYLDDEQLERGNVYLCPKCKNYDLKFVSLGLWD